MNSFASLNSFLGQPPNASEHGFQIDHILEFSHWFMAALFVGWTAYFIFVLIRFRKRHHPVADHQGVRSGISTHLEFSVVLIEAVLLIGFAIPLWAKRVNQFPETSNLIGPFTFPDQTDNSAAGMFIWSATQIRSGSIRMIPPRGTTSLWAVNCTCRSIVPSSSNFPRRT